MTLLISLGMLTLALGTLILNIVTLFRGTGVKYSREARLLQDIAVLKELREHESREEIQVKRHVIELARSRVLRSIHRYQSGTWEKWFNRLLYALVLLSIGGLILSVVFPFGLVLLVPETPSLLGAQIWVWSAAASFASTCISAVSYGNYYNREKTWASREAEMLEGGTVPGQGDAS